MEQPGHPHAQGCKDCGQQHTVDSPHLDQQQIHGQVGKGSDQGPEAVLMPDPGRVFIEVQQGVDLLHKEVDAEAYHSPEAQHQVLPHPDLHKGLIQTEQAAGTQSPQPGYQKGKTAQIPVVFLPALHHDAVADTGSTGIEQDAEDPHDGADNKEIVLVDRQHSQAQKGRYHNGVRRVHHYAAHLGGKQIPDPPVDGSPDLPVQTPRRVVIGIHPTGSPGSEQVVGRSGEQGDDQVPVIAVQKKEYRQLTGIHQGGGDQAGFADHIHPLVSVEQAVLVGKQPVGQNGGRQREQIENIYVQIRRYISLNQFRHKRHQGQSQHRHHQADHPVIQTVQPQQGANRSCIVLSNGPVHAVHHGAPHPQLRQTEHRQDGGEQGAEAQVLYPQPIEHGSAHQKGQEDLVYF